MAEIVVSAKNRADRGKNAARRLRREGLVPGVVYGGKGENLAVAVDPKALQKVLRSEAGRNAILKLDIADHGATNAILKSWQVDPVKESFLHADFYRIAMDVAIRVTVPIHVVGEARGVKYAGTYHNVGFRVLDRLAARENMRINERCGAALTSGEIQIRGQAAVLIRPQTYMNESGAAMPPVFDRFGAAAQNVIVIYDD